jgi:glycosyltransferase involved in cell wall biosynthesis
MKKLQDKYEIPIRDGWLRFYGNCPRNELPLLLKAFDVFLHAYVGSLDKSILEASAIGLPVITNNPEYINEFGVWGRPSDFVDLYLELKSLLETSIPDWHKECTRRAAIVRSNHSLEHWCDEITQIICRNS